MRKEYLKVPDDVDLKEFEKFGFRKHKRDNEDVLISKWTREWVVEDHLDGWETGGGWIFYPVIEIMKDRTMKQLDFGLYGCEIVYKLVHSGLVEKVVEDEQDD